MIAFHIHSAFQNLSIWTQNRLNGIIRMDQSIHLDTSTPIYQNMNQGLGPFQISPSCSAYATQPMFEPQLCRSNIHHFTTNQIPRIIHEVIEKFNRTTSYSQETKHLNETIPTLNYNVLRERSQELGKTSTIL